MEQHTSPAYNRHISPSLRDGLIALTGLTVAVGSFFNRDITLWWLGA